MTRQRRSISRFAGLTLGGLLAALPATAAFAAEPTTAAEAQQKAEHYRDQADFYASLGGTGYKSLQVRRAETEAAKYEGLADKLAKEAAGTPAATPSPQPPQPDCWSKPALQTPDCNAYPY